MKKYPIEEYFTQKYYILIWLSVALSVWLSLMSVALSSSMPVTLDYFLWCAFFLFCMKYYYLNINDTIKWFVSRFLKLNKFIMLMLYISMIFIIIIGLVIILFKLDEVEVSPDKLLNPYRELVLLVKQNDGFISETLYRIIIYWGIIVLIESVLSLYILIDVFLNKEKRGKFNFYVKQYSLLNR